MVIEIPEIEGSGELWLEVVRIICGESNGYLCDLMCHRAPYSSKLGFRHTTFVDIQYRGLDVLPDKTFVFWRKDVFEFLEECYSEFDVMICSDGIEHLNYFNGGKLMALMEQKSRKQIIFTPLRPQGITNDNHPDSHKSGWSPDDFIGWNSVVFPNFHPQLNCGAFFAYRCLESEKQRIYNEIKTKYVRENRPD